MFIEGEDGVWAKADARVFATLMAANRTARRLQSAERTMAGARKRVAALRRRIESATDFASAKAAAAIEREFQQSSQGWGRTFRVKAKPLRTAAGGSRRKVAAVKNGKASRKLRAYKAPLVDARGRTAIFFRVRYTGLKSKGWRPGLAADHALYILREEALELSGGERPISNMGETAAEVAAAWRMLEAAEEGYRANATVQYRIIWNLPHFLTAQERREMVEAFCERTFGRLGLPYVAAVHRPDAAGDERNWHAHVCFSTRPMERVGNGEWLIAEEKVNGLTDPAGLLGMRAEAAAHMNLACFKANHAPRFTHLSYRERGLEAERQEHVGPMAMAAHERGEAVGAVQRNAAIVEMNELGAEHAKTEREAALAGRLAALLGSQVDFAAKRGALVSKIATVHIIAQRAKALSTQAPTLSALPNRIGKITSIGQRAAAMVRVLRHRPQRIGMIRDSNVHEMGGRARQIATDLRSGQARRSALAEANRHLQSAKRAIADQHTRADREMACQIIATAQPAPYRIEQGRIVLDLAAMAPSDRSQVEALDASAVSAQLRRRYEQDREREADKEREQQARQEAERRQAGQRARAIDEACRILDAAKARAYRRADGKLVPDLSGLDERERRAVEVAGLGSDAVTETIRARAERDDHADALAEQAENLAATLNQASADLEARRQSPLEQRRGEAGRMSTPPETGDHRAGETTGMEPRRVGEIVDRQEPVPPASRAAMSEPAVQSGNAADLLTSPGALFAAVGTGAAGKAAPLSEAQKAAADSIVDSIEQEANFIFERGGLLKVSDAAMRLLEIDDSFFEHRYVQQRMQPLFAAQQSDVGLIFEHMRARHDQFEFIPGVSSFAADAPDAVRVAFARRDCGDFQRFLTAVIDGDAELKELLANAQPAPTPAKQRDAEITTSKPERQSDGATAAAFRFRPGGWER